MPSKTQNRGGEQPGRSNQGGHPESGKLGYDTILRHARPDVEPQRVARWAVRAQQEGML
ncbi:MULTISPECIES: hypothetical protein [Halobacterium]|uniref:hypothetical protein n=1 Tax=Halobacterium TaxID=2239 RepID=UPI000AF59635|nr:MULTISPECIES: hypothetical protein [Halobacterium]MCG1004878.1 hypothetical protein [Halobacterium noricense]